MFIPDPRWEEPNLLIPGKKPTGPVTIDWSHPLARGLMFCGLLDGWGLYDLAKCKFLNVSGTPSPTVVGPAGRGANFNSSGDYYENVGLSYVNQGDIAIIAGIRESGRSSVNGIVWYGGSSEAAGTDAHYFLNIQTDGDLRMFWEQSGGVNVSADAAKSAGVNEYSVVGVTREVAATSSVYFYEDGSQIGSTSGLANPGGSTNDTNSFRIGDSLVGQPFSGDIVFVYVYERALSAAEHAEISRNPYQILCPQ